LAANRFHQIDSGDVVAGKRDLFAKARIYDCAFFGTLAPFFRASESPIAIACLRLFTAPPVPPFPERRVPFFSRRTALSTDLPAALPYLRLLDFLGEPALSRVAISSSQKHFALRDPLLAVRSYDAAKMISVAGDNPPRVQKIVCASLAAELLCRKTQSRTFELPGQNECSRWLPRCRTVR
jgi:hypothetical protein